MGGMLHRFAPAGHHGVRNAAALLLSLSCASCGTVASVGNMFGSSGPQAGQPGYVQGFLGGVVADEPHAALAGREALSRGGTAADAAVAVALNLTVTLPSRAGLGGGGACLAFASRAKSVNGGVPEAVLFTPLPSAGGPNADRPAAIPTLARGLFLLHARYGKLPFESLVVSAEEAARFGVPTSRALARDLGAVAGPLLADPAARSVFSRNGAPLTEGQTLVQPALSATLAQLRVSGVGDFYQGGLAQRIQDNSPAAGGPLTVPELRSALPRLVAPLEVPAGNDMVAFLPPPADGGLAAAAAFQTLWHNPDDMAAAAARSLAVAARWRQGGVTAEALLQHAAELPAAGGPELPASTSFATLDREGNAVVCDLTMDNLFGTGRMVPTLGFLLAASPATVPPPLLAAAMAWNQPTHAFRAEVGGSGQNGAAIAVAAGMVNTLRTKQPMPVAVPEPGRANVIACSRYLPDEAGTCGWASDPREAGLATGGR